MDNQFIISGKVYRGTIYLVKSRGISSSKLLGLGRLDQGGNTELSRFHSQMVSDCMIM